MLENFKNTIVKPLYVQFRMHEKIMTFSSNYFYEKKLVADDLVRYHTLESLIDMSKIKDELMILNDPLIFIDTCNFQFLESKEERSFSTYNYGEARICKAIIDYLKSKNVKNDYIGVIAPYAAQVNLLMKELPTDEYRNIEISTVDGFQGREKEIIIISLTRSNERGNIGFLADKRRINVAITRARRMLVIICDSSTVAHDSFMYDFISHLNIDKAKMIDVSTLLNKLEIEKIRGKLFNINFYQDKVLIKSQLHYQVANYYNYYHQNNSYNPNNYNPFAQYFPNQYQQQKILNNQNYRGRNLWLSPKSDE